MYWSKIWKVLKMIIATLLWVILKDIIEIKGFLPDAILVYIMFISYKKGNAQVLHQVFLISLIESLFRDQTLGLLLLTRLVEVEFFLLVYQHILMVRWYSHVGILLGAMFLENMMIKLHGYLFMGASFFEGGAFFFASLGHIVYTILFAPFLWRLCVWLYGRKEDSI